MAPDEALLQFVDWAMSRVITSNGVEQRIFYAPMGRPRNSPLAANGFLDEMAKIGAQVEKDKAAGTISSRQRAPS